MSTSIQPIRLLSDVFSKGLSLGLLSKADVTKLANEIIMTESEPDYFFIQLSLAKNSNEIREILSASIKPTNSCISLRDMLGLIYNNFTNGDINLVEMSILMDTVNSKWLDIFTDYERDYIYQFDDEIQWMYKTDDKERLQAEVLQFLSVYQNLKLDNYRQWEVINKQIELGFPSEK